MTEASRSLARRLLLSEIAKEYSIQAYGYGWSILWRFQIKGQGRYPVPVILMARFALDLKEQGKGYGKTLFRDALRRALAGAEAIGGRAFLVHAKDEEARSFYMRFGMEPSPTNPLRLFFLFKDIRKSLDAAEQKKS